MAEPGRPEELIAALRIVALANSAFHTARDEIVLRFADALEAAGDGPFVIDATGRVLGTLEPLPNEFEVFVASDGENAIRRKDIAFRLRPSLTEEPQ